jgi:16S rRNA (cytosine1402-N4)-methyltransferase
VPDGRLYAIDRDERALMKARQNLKSFGGRVTFIHGDYRETRNLPEGACFDGILLDLGVSSFQLDDPEAGFSFRFDGPLDMRMDRSQSLTATDLVNSMPEDELKSVIREFGEERYAGRVAAAIVRRRQEKRIERTEQLADIVRSVVPRPRKPGAIDPATRTFQAIRIAVNDELSGLKEAISRFAALLNAGGRLVVISFHSLEDRAIKWTFREFAGLTRDEEPPGLPVAQERPQADFRILTKRPVTADEKEQVDNPRSRSAKLRALERITVGEPYAA